MVNLIVNSIIKQLRTHYSDIDIFADKVENEIEYPFIYVGIISFRKRDNLGGDDIYEFRFDVRYHVKGTEQNTDLYINGDKITSILKNLSLIDTGCNVWCNRAETQIVDGVAHNILEYEVMTREEMSSGIKFEKFNSYITIEREFREE